MSERVLYAPATARLLSRPHRELGRDRTGLWLAIDDAELTWPFETNVRVLYSSLAEYERAVRRLNPAGIDQVIGYRYANYDAVSGTLAVLADDLRDAVIVDEPHRLDWLRHLSKLTYARRMAGVAAATSLRVLVERQALLVGELGDDAGVESARASATELAGELAKLGRPEPAQALPRFDGVRVAVLRSASQATAESFEHHHDPTVWLGSDLVVLSSQHELAQRRDVAAVLYWSPGPFLAAVEQASVATERDLGDRLARVAREPDLAQQEQLARLLYDQLLLALAIEDTPAIVKLRARSLAALGTLLQTHPSALGPDLCDDDLPTLPALPAVRQRLHADAAFAHQLYRSHGLGEIALDAHHLEQA